MIDIKKKKRSLLRVLITLRWLFPQPVVETNVDVDVLATACCYATELLTFAALRFRFLFP